MALRPPDFDMANLSTQRRLAPLAVGYLFAVGAIIGGLWTLYSDYSFVRGSAVVQGELIGVPHEHRTGGFRNPHTEYRVKYQFRVDGLDYRGEDSIRAEPKIRTITVHYLRSDPSINKAELPQLWISWGCLIAGVFIGGAMIEERRRRQRSARPQ
jgi:hypothetical protein